MSPDDPKYPGFLEGIYNKWGFPTQKHPDKNNRVHPNYDYQNKEKRWVKRRKLERNFYKEREAEKTSKSKSSTDSSEDAKAK